MKIILKIAVLLSLLLPNLILSQAETSNWYFGNKAGITFNDDGSVTALTDGELKTDEGCTTISDALGNLLFYTDGTKVYDKNHNIMPNGNNLNGDNSSTQSALIVPQPENDDIYYIFTVGTKITAKTTPITGLYYSIVDLRLNNGSGDITQKNILLLNESAEKITAVAKDCSDEAIWLITFSSIDGNTTNFDTFHAYEINKNGVEQNPVSSTIAGLNLTEQRGYLKVSPNSKKIVTANLSKGLFLYDFNSFTGVVSNQQKIALPPTGLVNNIYGAYGVEFSSNSQYLYVSVSNGKVFGTIIDALLQYDLLAPNIENSLETLDTGSGFRGALQLGPNRKIYRTIPETNKIGSSFLSVINNPNQKGNAANYVKDAIPLAGNFGIQGLPPFIQSFFNIEDIVLNDDGTKGDFIKICEGEGFTLELITTIPNGIYTWEKNDIVLPTQTSSRLHVPSATVNDSGNYRLTITFTTPDCPIIGESEVVVNPSPTVPVILPLEQCDTDSNTTDGISLFDLTQVDQIQDPDIKFTFYANALDQTSDIAIIDPDKYINSTPFSQKVFFQMENQFGCKDSGEFLIEVKAIVFTPNMGGPISACDSNPLDTLLEGTFDLDAIKQSLYGTATVTFYANQVDATAEQNPLGVNLTTANTTIYVRIANGSQCQTVESIDLVVDPSPSIAGITLALEQCDTDSDTTDGINAFDLTQIDQDPTIDFTFYASAQDQASNTAIANPAAYINSTAFSQKVFYKIENQFGCEDSGELTLKVTPITFNPNTGGPISACDNDPLDTLLEGTFDLDAIKQSLYGTATVTFYANQADATAEQNALGATLTSEDTTIYARIDNNSTTNGCHAGETIELKVNPLPSISGIETILEQCDTDSDTTDGFSLFDLTQIDQDPTIDFTFYANAQDQASNTAIANPAAYINSTAFSQKVFYKIENQFGCEDSGELTLKVTPITFNPNTGGPISACDNDPLDTLLEGDFDLDAIKQSLYGTATVTFYANQADATAEQNALGVILTSEDTTIYARIGNNSTTNGCRAGETIELKVNPLPSVSGIERTLEQCDTDLNFSDAISVFDLTQIDQDPTIDFTFYANGQDLANNIAIIDPVKYTYNQASSQNVFYEITNQSGCKNIGELTLTVNLIAVIPNPESPISTCDITIEDNVLEGDFDLDAIKQDVYNATDVIFYANQSDAVFEANPIDGNFISSDTTIYTRVKNNDECQTIERIDLIVLPLPEVTLEESYQVCANGDPIKIDAPPGFDTYTWYRIDGQNNQEISTTQQVLINDAGSYFLEVGIDYPHGRGKTTPCSTSFDFEVILSSVAIFEKIIITDFAEDNSIYVLVSGDGDYEYSIDGLSYTDNDLFENVPPGYYNIFVRDKNGCGISEEEITVVGFSKFFTPNGDGINDFWQIIGANSDLVTGDITIYDRYGKIIKQISIDDKGWDGTYNGKPLPSSDYWFTTNLSSEKQMRGHFTLKR